tara:strand:- start:12 stop:278 length:267 start_codon:yes stop_codon:yes gene_type:complete
MQIGATNSTRSHFKDQVIRARLRIVDLLDSERDTGLFENSRFHGQLGIIVRLNDIGICKTALGITTCVETAYSEESQPSRINLKIIAL